MLVFYCCIRSHALLDTFHLWALMSPGCSCSRYCCIVTCSIPVAGIKSIVGRTFEASCQRIIRSLDKAIVRMEKQLYRHVEQQSEWTEKHSMLNCAPGVGDNLVYTLLTDLPELGTPNYREISA